MTARVVTWTRLPTVWMNNWTYVRLHIIIKKIATHAEFYKKKRILICGLNKPLVTFSENNWRNPRKNDQSWSSVRCGGWRQKSSECYTTTFVQMIPSTIFVSPRDVSLFVSLYPLQTLTQYTFTKYSSFITSSKNATFVQQIHLCLIQTKELRCFVDLYLQALS